MIAVSQLAFSQLPLGADAGDAFPIPSAATSKTPIEHGEPNWYLCFAKPRQETLAAEHLLQQGYAVYVPSLLRWSRRAAGWQRHEVPMFPRYAFVRPGNPGQAIGPVRNTPGVTSLVRFGQTLATISNTRLQALKGVVDQFAQATPQRPLAVGLEVVFQSGPLQGARGIVSAVAEERVAVLMALMGRQQIVSVPVNQLGRA